LFTWLIRVDKLGELVVVWESASVFPFLFNAGPSANFSSSCSGHRLYSIVILLWYLASARIQLQHWCTSLLSRIKLISFRVIARKGCPIWRLIWSDGVAIGHNFWSMKPMYLKFLLEMTNLIVIISLIF